MKQITIFILLSFFTFNSYSQEQFWKVFKNDLEKLGLSDSITFSSQSHHKISRHQGVEKIFKRSNYRGYNINYLFNESGNITLEVSINEDSSIYSTTTYKYQKGRLFEKIKTYDSLTFYRTLFKYDSNNQVIKEIKLGKNNDTSRIVYRKYNKEGNLIELLSDDQGDGQLYYKFTYKYFPHKHIIKSTCYDKKGKVSYKRNYLQDKHFNLIRMTTIRNRDKSATAYYYNDKNLLIKKESVNFHHNNEFKYVINYEYIYDSSGQWIKKVEFNENSSDGQIWIRTTKIKKLA